MIAQEEAKILHLCKKKKHEHKQLLYGGGTGGHGGHGHSGHGQGHSGHGHGNGAGSRLKSVFERVKLGSGGGGRHHGSQVFTDKNGDQIMNLNLERLHSQSRDTKLKFNRKSHSAHSGKMRKDM